MTVADDLATLRIVRKEHTLARTPADWDYETHGDYVLNEDGTRKHEDDCPGCAANAALDRVEAEIARLEREVRQQDVLIQRWMTEAEDKQAEIARLQRHPDAWSQEAFDQQKARAEAAEDKNAKLSALIVEQEAEYRKNKRAAEGREARLRADYDEARTIITEQHAKLWLVGLDIHPGEERPSAEDCHRNLDRLLAEDGDSK